MFSVTVNILYGGRLDAVVTRLLTNNLVYLFIREKKSNTNRNLFIVYIKEIIYIIFKYGVLTTIGHNWYEKIFINDNVLGVFLLTLHYDSISRNE